MFVQLDRFGEKVWVKVSSIAGEICHPDQSGNLFPVGSVLFETQPQVTAVKI